MVILKLSSTYHFVKWYETYIAYIPTAIYFATNGDMPPSSGPNRIIEYRNLSYDVTLISDPENNAQFIELHPNVIPGNGTLNVSASDSFVNSTLSIFSYSGQLIRDVLIEDNELSISNLDLPSGSYFIKASNENGTVSKTFVVR